MAFPSDFVPRLRPMLVERVGAEAVIWVESSAEPVALDPLATVMLEVIDGEATVEDLVSDVHDVVGVSVEVAGAQVDRILQFLQAAGALVSSPPPERVPELQRELFLNPPST